MKSTVLPSMTETRVCKKCNTEKPIGKFGVSCGYRIWTCRSCRGSMETDARRSRFLADPEYWEKWKEKARVRVNAYAKRNREKLRLRQSLWVKENPEKARSTCNAWRERNPEKSRLRYKKYHQKLPLRYVNYKLGGSPEKPYPEEFLKMKQSLMKLNRLIKEKEDAKGNSESRSVS